MADDLQASLVRIEVKLSGEANTCVEDNENPSLSGNTDSQINKKNDEETSSDGEFINVEKEILQDVEENPHLLKATAEVDKTSDTVDHGLETSDANVNFIQMKEKIKELELQLESVLGNLKRSEDEKASVNYDIYQANKKLVDISQYCEELELGQKLMKNQMLEAEEKYNFQLKLVQETLKATELKDKQLSDTRESFIALSIELDSSKERIKALEEEAMSSVDELHKLQEVSKHSTSQADLELAHVNPRKMEDQISNVQKELSELHGEIAEKRQIEETLQLTSLNLSMSQENLETLKSKVTELEQKVASQDAYIYTLTEELNLHKVSEEQTETMLSASNEDLQSKLVDLEVLENKLQEQTKEMEAVEACFKNQEMQTSSLKNDLSDLNREKATLEITVTDLRKKLLENEEINRQLEAIIKQDNQDFQKANSLLSQALYKEELEQKLELLEQLHHTSRTATLAATNRNLEIEGLVQASISTEEVSRAQVKEDEMQMEFSEKRNMELEEQINITETKYLGAMNEIKELNEKITLLTTLWKEIDEENSLLRRRFKNYEDRIDQLEYSLKKSSLRNTELEKELNDLLKTCVEHEEQAALTHNHSLELEDLINSSRLRAEDTEKRVEELEILLNTSNCRRQELEKLLSITQAKHKDVSDESNIYRMKVSELVTEHEACQAHSATLETAANEKESELTNLLNSAFEERKIFEDLSKVQEELIYKSENRILILQNELNSLRDERESVREEMKSSSVREEMQSSSFQEKELLGKLGHLTEQLEHHREVVEETAARNLELNSFNICLVRETELKLQDAAANLKQKEFGATKLQEKLKFLEEQLSFYKEQYAEASENVTSLNAELRFNATKMVSLENTIEELRLKVSEGNMKGERTLSDNELLTTSNSNLRKELEVHQHKVNELNELLKFIQDEKEATIRENKNQLHEAVEKHKQRDSEARKLSEKLLELESQLKTYQKQANESAAQNGKLGEALSKLQDMEGSLHQLKHEYDQLKSENQDLARSNLSLFEELVAYDTKMNELKVALNEVIMEKEDTLMQLNSFKYEMKDLSQLHNSNKEELHLQIKSVMEENNMLNEQCRKEKSDFEATLVQFEAKIKELKERELFLASLVDNLEAQMCEKTYAEAELDQQLGYAKEQLEHPRKALEEFTTRHLDLTTTNESLVRDSELKLQEVAIRFKQKESESKELLEKLKSLEEKLALYKDLALESTEVITSLQSELAANALKVVSLENNVEELQQQASEANLRIEHVFFENDLLGTSNSKLKEELEYHQHKVNELNEVLKSIHAEKETTVELLASHANIIETLTEEHSRGMELQLGLESRIKEKEALLHEATMKNKQSDIEANELHDKLLALETLFKTYEEQATELAVVAATQKGELEEAILKIQNLEGAVEELESKSNQLKSENQGLARQNLILSEGLGAYETKINELQIALETAVTENAAKKEIEDLMQLPHSDKEKLQTQITSLMEDNVKAKEMYHNAKGDLEATSAKLEEKLSEQEAREFSLNSVLERLTAELFEKSVMHDKLEQKLRFFREQLESQRKDLEEINERNLELNSLNEYLVKDSELKLREAATHFNKKEFEAKELLERLKFLEKQLEFSKEQAVEATENVASLKAELESNEIKLIFLENKVEELKQQISEANLRAEQMIGEHEQSSTSNTHLIGELEFHCGKTNELNEFWKSTNAEKEVTIKQLTSHVAKVIDEHSRGLELQSEIESRLKENEAQLHEAIEKQQPRDLKAVELHEKIFALETQLIIYEKQASEVDIESAIQKDKIIMAALRIQYLEGLVEKLKIKSDQFKTQNEGLKAHSLTLSEELLVLAYEAKINKLQVAFNSAITEKEDIFMQLLYSKKEKEDLMQLLKSDMEKLQSQVNSIMEENIMLNEMYQNTKKELEANIEKLEKDLSEQKGREFYLDSLVERLKVELSDKSFVHEELSKKLTYAEEQFGLHKNVLAEVHSRNLELNSLNEYLVKDSESQIKEAAARFKQKESEARELLVRLKSAEEQLSFRKEEAIEAAQNSASLEADLRENAIRLHYFEDKVEELEQKISESNLRGEQTLAENELLATLNTKFKEDLEANEHKVSELNELLISIHAEKESMIEQLTCRVLKLTDEHSRGLDLQCAAESRYRDNETQLHEATEKLKQRDIKITELLENLDALEMQLQVYEKHASESALVEETQKRKLEVAVSKIRNLEGLIDQLKAESDQVRTLNDDLTRHNLRLNEKIVTYEKKINEMQEAFDAVVAERDGISMQLRHSMKEMDDLIQLLKSDEDKVQSQVTSVMEENTVLREVYKIDREKHEEGTVVQLEQKAKECPLELLVKSLKAEFFEKSIMQDDLQQKLCHTEEQLEYHIRSLAEVAARNLELNSLNKSITNNSELKLQEAAASFEKKESETQELLGNLKSVEEQLAFWKEQAVEATESVTSLKAELAANVMKLASLESNIEEMKRKVSEANRRSEQILAENELMSTSNLKLTVDLEAHRHKDNELNQLLKSIQAEKEVTIEQLTSHVAKLTDEHSRGLELQTVTESRLKEKEAQLLEAIEKHKKRDVDATELLAKQVALETQLKTFEKHASESTFVGETQKGKLEEATLKVQNLENLVQQLKTESNQIKNMNEGLTKHNLNLFEVNASYATQINELQQAFEVAAAGKKDISIQLDCCKKEMEGFIQHFKSDKEKLQSEVKSVTEENIVLNAIHHNEKKEFEATIVQLEEKLTEESLEKLLIQEDLRQKLRYAEEQLEHHRRSLAEIAARNLELNSLNESIIKNSELKLQEATANLKQKESEIEELRGNLKSVEEQLAFYMERSVEAAENVASLKAEVVANVTKMISLESNIEEMKQKVLEANLRSKQTLAKNELLATMTSKLTIDLEAQKHEANELSESLKFHHAEKEATIEQLTYHVAKLSDEHSRGLELQYATESRLKEKEAQLLEATEKHKQRDVDATELLAKQVALETQLKTFEKHVSESARFAETQRGKLEEAALKVQNLENLVDQMKIESDQIKTINEGLTIYNLNLSAVNALYETRINELQQAFEIAATEKEDISIQHDCCKKEIEDLIQLFKSDKEKLHSQVKSVMEENIVFNAMYQNEKNEFEATALQLEEKRTEQKARECSLGSLLEILKAESLEKLLIQEDLQQKLRYTEEQLEHYRGSLAEVSTRNLELNLLNESIIRNSELKLQEAAANFKQKVSETEELLENLKSIEEQLAFYKEQAVEATKNVASVRAELVANVTKIFSLERNIVEMNQMILDANVRSEQTVAENELLATTNSKLTVDLETHKHKTNELNEFLNSVKAEKEAIIEHLTLRLENLTSEHSRGLEFQSVAESRLKESETQLLEAIEKHKLRDVEATELLGKVLALETQLRTCEKKLFESSTEAETHKIKLEETAFKIQDLEGLNEQLKTKLDYLKRENEGLTRCNLKMTEKFAAYETKVNELEAAFGVAIAEKENMSMQLYSTKKEMEYFMQVLEFDKEELQMQVKSAMEENVVLNQMFEMTRKELEETIVQLKEKLSEQKARELSLDSLVESFKTELSEKHIMQEELGKKLNYAEEQLEDHRKSVAEVTERNFELYSLNESLAKCSELKLHEAAARLKEKESEARELLETLNSLEEQLNLYKKQATEATETAALVEAEMAVKVAYLVKNAEELKKEVSEANVRSEQTLAENKLLATANSKLKEEVESSKNNINELNEYLKSAHAEKEATFEELASHVSTIENLTHAHARGLELQFVTQSRLKENEAQLYEAIEKHKQRDLEARELHEKLLALEGQLQSYEMQVREPALDAATQKDKSEETLVRVKKLEGLAEQLKNKSDHLKIENEGLVRYNVSLSEELVTYETKVNELQLAFDAAVKEKEVIFLQLHSSNREMEDLSQLSSDKEKFQLRVASVTEENIALNELYRKTKKELEMMMPQLEETLNRRKEIEFTLHSLVDNLKAELTEKSLMQEELGQKFVVAEEQLEYHMKCIAEMTSRNLELNSLNESLVNNAELKLQEEAMVRKKKESEARVLFGKLNFLENQLVIYKEQVLDATETITSLKVELVSSEMKVAYLESHVEDLKKNNSEANLRGEETLAENEFLSMSNSKLKEELESAQDKINELNELVQSLHSEKEFNIKKLTSHASTTSMFLEEHSRGLKLQATESHLKEREAEQLESIEKHNQRDLETNELQQKLIFRETQLRSYQEQASESAVAASIWKGKLEEAVFHIQELEDLIEQLQTMLDQFKNENESLAKHNLSLSQELTAYETKMNEFQLLFDAASREKENLSRQLHFSRKEMEDNLELLNFNNKKLQPQIASVLEENIIVNQIHQKGRQELEANIVQVDEKVRNQKAKEFYLNSLVDNLKAELSEKSLMKAQILELEQKMLLAEETYSRKIESMVSAADEKDAVLTTKLMEHRSLIQERDILHKKLKGILKELSLAQRTIMEQRKMESRKDINIQAFMDQSLDASKCKNQDSIELKQKLLEAKTQYKLKIAEEGKKIRLLNAELNELRLKLSRTSEMKMKIVMLENALACTTSAQEVKNESSPPAELRVALEVKSRDRGLGTSTLTERKINYRSSSMHQVTEGIDECPHVHVGTDPSVAMAFKFILGVAWVSMIIGIILGKRY